MSYDNTNKGIISKNTRKDADTHPDIKGQINVDGTEYWLDGWLKQKNDGTGSFYSLSIKPKNPPAAPAKPPPPKPKRSRHAYLSRWQSPRVRRPKPQPGALASSATRGTSTCRGRGVARPLTSLVQLMLELAGRGKHGGEHQPRELGEGGCDSMCC